MSSAHPDRSEFRVTKSFGNIPLVFVPLDFRRVRIVPVGEYSPLDYETRKSRDQVEIALTKRVIISILVRHLAHNKSIEYYTSGHIAWKMDYADLPEFFQKVEYGQ